VQRVSATANCVSDVTADSLRPYRLPVLSLDKRDDVAMKGASTEVLEACWFLDEVRSIRANDVANLDCTGGGFEGLVRSAYGLTSAFPCLNDVVRMSATRLEQAILPAMRAAAVDCLQLAADASRPNARHHEDGAPGFNIRARLMCQL